MIPPNLPINVVPVTSQLDPVRQPPAIPPVTPVQPSPGDPTLEFRQRDQEEAAQRLHEEFQRQHRQQRGHNEPQEDEPVDAEEPEAYLPTPGYALNADDTVPVAPLIDNEPRPGMLINIQV